MKVAGAINAVQVGLRYNTLIYQPSRRCSVQAATNLVSRPVA